MTCFTRMDLNRVLFLLGLVAGMAATTSAVADGPATAGPGPKGPMDVPVTIHWAMAERFGPGYDLNRDGRPDLPNSYEYVNPGGYEIQLAVTLSPASTTILSCDWTIEDRDCWTTSPAKGLTPTVRLPQGTYSATARYRLTDGRSGSTRETIQVRDLLIVVLGDSPATGEGNPEEPARWEESRMRLLGRLDPPRAARWADGGPDGDQPRETPGGPLPPASVSHVRAYRSTQSGVSRFAMRLEAEDPHTSVTFVSFAATGARTDDLFRPDRSGQNRALDPGPVLPAQLEEFHAVVGSRPVDVLVLSIGINESRCFELIAEMIHQEIRHVDPLRLLATYPTRATWAAAGPDVEAPVAASDLGVLEAMDADKRSDALAMDVKLIYDLDEKARAGLEVVRAQLERVREAFVAEPRLAWAHVYLLDYPDPTRVAGGATGEAILDDLVPGLRLNRRELDLIRERILGPLNRARQGAACRSGCTDVDEIFESFHCHGYATPDPWFERAKESEERQGPRLGPVGYICGDFPPGMLHPNQRRHEVIAECLYRSHSARRTRTDRD
jgi:hypothetical protein